MIACPQARLGKNFGDAGMQQNVIKMVGARVRAHLNGRRVEIIGTERREIIEVPHFSVGANGRITR